MNQRRLECLGLAIVFRGLVLRLRAFQCFSVSQGLFLSTSLLISSPPALRYAPVYSSPLTTVDPFHSLSFSVSPALGERI